MPSTLTCATISPTTATSAISHETEGREKTMEWKEVDSSQIHSVAYDAETQTLGIRFKTTKTKPITEYHYSNITKSMYDSLVSAESVGRYFGNYIKAFPNDFPFTKVA